MVMTDWNRTSPVLEKGFRISGEIVGQVLYRVLGHEPRTRSITMEDWVIGGLFNSTHSTGQTVRTCLH